MGRAVPEWPSWPSVVAAGHPNGGAIRGLFAGGTLRDEAMIITAERLGQAGGHVMIDFGDDELTAGRPHPMIDQRLRLARLAAEAADPRVAVILLDVVLGHGAHPDPASELAPAIAAALAGRAGGLAVVVSLIGARSDPQGLAGQAAALAGAGAHVFASNAQAARFACELAAGGTA
jgi:FdrA protein